ncbi:PH domain-containing protein [Pseudoxanthomonas putridarboris]|uniref:PH domain-containing protein n=1 Tax=Pseudoxanthomonas putridarboris TaxID=752605 RepID=A0ABU9J1Y7_9GAMM
MQRTQEFAVAPIGQGAWLWVWVPMLLAVAAMIAAMTMEQQTPMPWGWLAIPLVLLIGAGLSMALRRRRIFIDNRELRIHATLYTRKLVLEAIDLDKARVVSLEEHTDLKPRLKTNGFYLPGFHAGHFRLRNLTKAFCLITDRTRVLALPLRDGGLVLLSPTRPADLLARLRELAAPAHHR